MPSTKMYCETLSSNFLKNHRIMIGKIKKITPTKTRVETPNVTQKEEVTSPLAIPATAENVDCAYAYIDALIAPEANAELATNLVSGAVNTDAVDLVGKEAQIYDYDLVTNTLPDGAFESVTPPE